MIVSLEKSQTLLNAIGKMAKVGGWELDLPGNTLIWTDEVFRIHETPEGFVPTLDNALHFYTPESRPIIQNAVTSLINGGTSFDLELEIVTAKNHRRWVHALGQSIHESAADVRLFGTFQDITERRATEKKLQEDEKVKQAILDGISASIAFVNVRQELIWANRNASAMAQRPLPEMIGKTCHSLWADPRKPCDNCPTLRAMQSRKAEVGVRKGIDGKTWSERSEPVFDLDGNVLGVVEIVQDISMQTHLETRLRQSEKMESIGHLAAGIAHDFNNILFAISGNTEIALKVIEPLNPIAKQLEQIVKATNRAKELVKKILSFSRQGEQTKQVLSIATEVNESISLLRASIPSSVLFDVDLGSLQARVIGDPTSIHEILINIFTNACQAMNGRGRLGVQLREEFIAQPTTGRIGEISVGHYVVLDVSDTGTGMDARTMEQLFEPFFTTKPVGQGTGMGLAVVYGLMQFHGGNIQLQSELGKGTRFQLYFPSVDAEQSIASMASTRHKSKGERILFVDDESEIVAMAVRGLSLFGYNVRMAANGKDALQIFAQKVDSFDLLITDQTMPFMTGMELAKAVHAIKPDFPIILMTGYSKQIHEELTAVPGVRKICYKPMNLEELVQAIQDCLK